MARTQEVQDTARVAPLVVIPCNKFNKTIVEGDAGGGIEDARVIVSIQVSRYKCILRVGYDALIRLAAVYVTFHMLVHTLIVSLRGFLQRVLDIIVAGRLLQAAGQVNNGHV